MRHIFMFFLLTAGASATDMISIPAGSFVMGCSPADKQCERDEKPALSVDVPAFLIDSREVTVADYRACVERKQCQAPKTHARNKYCNYDAPGRDTHPINCIDWANAKQFCALQGKRLPQEAEWEKAARAGSRTRYAWGETLTCKQAIANDGKTTGSVKGELDGCGEDRSWPVTSRAPNAWGLYDMHGNTGEWIINFYAPDAIAHYAKGELDYPKHSEQKVVRGGSWDEKMKNLRNSFRNSKLPVSGGTVYGSIGFRCVKSSR